MTVDNCRGPAWPVRLAWWAAQAAVFVGACAWMAMRGGFCVLGWGAVLLLGWIGIRDLTRRLGRRRHAAGFALLLLAAGALGSYVHYRTTGRSLFRRYLGLPVPQSVRIVESHYAGGLDPACYLHFRAEPADIRALLARQAYTAPGEDQHPPSRSADPFRPDWFRPESLANPALHVLERRSSTAWLWISESGGEAYFVYWNF